MSFKSSLYITTLFIFIFSSFFAQESYYNNIDFTKTGDDLRFELASKVISTHTNLLSYGDVWNATQQTDLNPNNNANVLLIYGYENGNDNNATNDIERNKFENGGSVGDWNREHTFANSLASPKLESSGRNRTAYADAHNLRACDVQRNSNRGSKKFAQGSGFSGVSGNFWYPGDQWKGDVARIIMYMYLRYGNQCKPNLVTNGITNAADANMIDLLLTWNAEDKVSAYEINRNTYLGNTTNRYAQGNRNPFIDNPRLATQIWGGTAAEDRWGIFNNDNIPDEEEDEDNGDADMENQLLISEYVEGSSFNKYIEIANITHTDIALDNYTLKIATNGSNNWAYTYSFPNNSTINKSDVFVIAHENATICSSQIDNRNSNITNFNGNDVVGLFVNDELIDIIGLLGQSNNFAKNVTLVRKSNTTKPTTTFSITDWNQLDQDTCTNLGIHHLEILSNKKNHVDKKLNIKLDPQKLTISTPQKINQLILINVQGKIIHQSFLNTINTEHIPHGIYILKAMDSNQTYQTKLAL